MPLQPESLEQTGLPEAMVEQLLVKILYFHGELYGGDLSTAIGLKFSVISDLVEALKLRHHIQVKRSLGMGGVGAQLTLTEAGRERAREYLEANQYSGPAPVPLAQYIDVVKQQRPREGWLTKEALTRAFRGIVITERVLVQVGPAVSSMNSLLIYGKPGDGKTFLIEALNHLDAVPIYVPHAIECQGNIVQVYDPVYHQRLEEEAVAVSAISMETTYDHRWAKCKRPFIVSGGEMSPDMLDLRYNQTSKVYEAPFQLKANNGIYLIDDFGRQRATPAEILNRWIVPMERRVDYLSFLTGGKMTVPFETFLVFSTNLNPADLGDEAFLRRIQYKMLLRSPSEQEFVRIFEDFCHVRQIPCDRALIARFIDRHYQQTGKQFRRCHPRDVLTHALNLMHFERLRPELTDEVLDRAFESCFLQEQDGAPITDAPILAPAVETCASYWAGRAAKTPTAFGVLALVASLREDATGRYVDTESASLYGSAETHNELERMHLSAFRKWLQLTLDQQVRDLTRYCAAGEGRALELSRDRMAVIRRLAPASARPEEISLFATDLTELLTTPTPGANGGTAARNWELEAAAEQTA